MNVVFTRGSRASEPVGPGPWRRGKITRAGGRQRVFSRKMESEPRHLSQRAAAEHLVAGSRVRSASNAGTASGLAPFLAPLCFLFPIYYCRRGWLTKAAGPRSFTSRDRDTNLPNLTDRDTQTRSSTFVHSPVGTITRLATLLPETEIHVSPIGARRLTLALLID